MEWTGPNVSTFRTFCNFSTFYKLSFCAFLSFPFFSIWLPVLYLTFLLPLTLYGFWIDFTEILNFFVKNGFLIPQMWVKMLFFLPSAKGQNLTARSNIDLLVKLHQIWNFSKSMRLCYHLIGNVLKK